MLPPRLSAFRASAFRARAACALFFALIFALMTLVSRETLAHDRLDPPAPPGATVAGVALAVTDGDSFVLRGDDGRRLAIRVAAIDAPEKGQPWGDAARRRLAALMRDRPLLVRVAAADRYGRTVAQVSTPEGDVGLAMIAAGLAWHFERYASRQPSGQRAEYAAAQRRARDHGIGLWAADAPEAPWIFRERQRSATHAR